MMLSLFLALGAALMSVSATPPSDGASVSPAQARPTITFCTMSFANVLVGHAEAGAQLEEDLDKAGLAGESRAAQEAVCGIYYRGMMDYIIATGPHV